MGNKNIFSKIKEYISKLLNSKPLIILVLLIIFFTMLYVYIRPVESDTKKSENNPKDIVAYIDGEKITFNEVEKRAEEILYFDKKNIIKNLGTDIYKKELSKYVIYEDILYRKAKEENINVTKEEIRDTYHSLENFITGTDIYKKELSKYVIYEDILYRKAKEENINVTKEEIRDTYHSLENFITENLNLTGNDLRSKQYKENKKIMRSMRKTIKA